MDLRALTKILAPLKRRIQLMLNRGVVVHVYDDQGIQRLQITGLADEVLESIERFQQYGFTSVPLPGAEVLFASLGGTRSHSVVFAADDKAHRKRDLAPGELAVYHHEGDFLLFKNGRIVELVSGGKVKVTAPEVDVTATALAKITAPLTEIVGPLNVSGLITGQGGLAVSGGAGAAIEGSVQVTGGDVTADGISLKGHTHQGDSGGQTSTPQ